MALTRGPFRDGSLARLYRGITLTHVHEVPMYITTRRIWKLRDGEVASGREVPLQPGRHEMEEIPNPTGNTIPWFVLKGMKIGLPKNRFEAFDGLAGDDGVIIDYDP